MRTATICKDVAFRGRNKIRNIIFEELESVSIPTVAFDNVQVSILVTDQEAFLDPQPENVEQLLIHNEVSVSEEQTQPPQELTLVRRSTRERKSAISNDFIVFL